MKSLESERLGRLDLCSSILGGLSFLTLLQYFGFPHLRLPNQLALVWSAVLSTALFIESLSRLLIVADPWRYLSRHPLRYLILLMIALELSGVASWSAGIEGSNLSSLVGQIYLSISLFAHIGSWLKAAILANRWLANLRIPVLALPPLTFGLAIAAGGLLLMMPGMRRTDFGFLDALFTSSSAICVTGLSTIDIGAALSPVGKALLLALIQVGGIGTLTVMGMLALWTSGQLSIGERAAFSELLGGEQLADTRRVVATTIKATLSIEFIGALSLWLAFRGRVEHPLLFGIFHAVSAFCNAGFSLFNDSLAGFKSDIPLLSTVMLLIFSGSLGFPALSNLWHAGITRLVPWSKSETIFRETRFALRSSLLLIAAGTAAVMLDSWIGGKGRSLLEAIFQSVTLRTAGFQVESQLPFGTLGTWSAIALMAIGASPQSTGGGMKTTLAARLFLRLDAQERDKPSRPFFRTQSFRIASLLAGLYLAIATGAGALISAIDGPSLMDALYESFSALGTVGLSRDLTPFLSTPAKLIVMLLMFTGRVLYPTLVVGVVRQRRKAPGDADWA